MDDPQTETRIFTREEVAFMRRLFQQMVEGQGVSLYVADPGVTSRRITVTALGRAGFEDIRESDSLSEVLKIAAIDETPLIIAIVDDTCAARGLDECLTFLRRFRRTVPQGEALLTGSRLTAPQASQAVETGALAFFRRPLDMDSLIARVREICVKKMGNFNNGK